MFNPEILSKIAFLAVISKSIRTWAWPLLNISPFDSARWNLSIKVYIDDLKCNIHASITVNRIHGIEYGVYVYNVHITYQQMWFSKVKCFHTQFIFVCQLQLDEFIKKCDINLLIYLTEQTTKLKYHQTQKFSPFLQINTR